MSEQLTCFTYSRRNNGIYCSRLILDDSWKSKGRRGHENKETLKGNVVERDELSVLIISHVFPSLKWIFKRYNEWISA